MNGNPLESLKISRKKNKKMRIFESHSAKKSESRDPLGFFNIRSVAKYQNKFEDIKKFSKKSLTKPKKGRVS